MKNKIFNWCLAMAWLAVFGQDAFAVTFSNTPTTVSNTYTGTITLLISNVPTGHTVVVQKYIDVNTNGIIDGRDLLVQQFRLTDGQAGMVIGGVTNYNVPGDLNATTGAITATLNFNNGDFMQNLVGKYFYRLTSPVGDFAPITNSFTVTNFPFAQKFTGNVVSNSTSTTLSNAFVILFPPPRSGNHGPGQPLGGTVANSAGVYSIAMPAGTYTLLAFCTNYVGNFNSAPVLTLTNTASFSTNLSLTVATTSISGSIVDATNSAVVLPGVFVPVNSTNGLLAATCSDTNGNYTVRVTTNQWSVGSDDSGLIIHGYVGFQNGTNVVSPAANVVLAFPKANALFYGMITNIQGNPMVGIDVNDQETVSNLYSMDGYTDANGNYFVGALGFGGSDPWQLSLSSEGTPTNYVFSQPMLGQNGSTNLAVGQAVLQNFSAILATNLITGNVKDSNSNNISGAGMFATTNINGTTYQASADTDANGNYALNVFNGIWDVGINCNTGNDSLSQLGSYDCPNDQFSTIAGKNVTNNFIVQICGGISINTASPLPVGEVNAFYNQSIQASDCTNNYLWSQTGGTLPGGLNLAAGGSAYVLSGFPTGSGTFSFTVQVGDGNGNVTNQTFSVTISNALQITTASLPNGTNGSAYSQSLQATGGQPPYTWSLLSGSLPGNLNLTPGSGLISGTATNSGTFSFTAQVSDSFDGTNSQPLSITINNNNTNPPPPVGIASAGGQLLIYYPLSGSNYVLQTATNVNGPWMAASNGIPVTAITFSNSAPAQFFRLH